MAMTLLELLREFTDRRNLTRPEIVMASSDETVSQLRALANEVISDLTSRGRSWAALQKEATFVSAAAQSQGLLATIAPYGFKYVVPDTLFDRTDRRPLYGPRNAADWQQSQAIVQTGPFYSYRIWGSEFYLQPAPPAGHTIVFEYASDMAIKAEDGTWRKRFFADTDTFALDEDVLLSGLNWKWRREQGLSYTQEKMDYEAMLTQLAGTESTRGAISLSGGSSDIKPGFFVPSGNWPV